MMHISGCIGVNIIYNKDILDGVTWTAPTECDEDTDVFLRCPVSGRQKEPNNFFPIADDDDYYDLSVVYGLSRACKLITEEGMVVFSYPLSLSCSCTLCYTYAHVRTYVHTYTHMRALFFPHSFTLTQAYFLGTSYILLVISIRVPRDFTIIHMVCVHVYLV